MRGSLIPMAAWTSKRSGAPIGAISRSIRESFASRSRPWLSGAPTAFSSVIANPLGEGTLWIAATPFGPHTGTGILVAAAARAAFPTEVETLLLSVAASKATIVVHEARLVDSRRRTTAELARRVAERTGELTAANDALRKEVVERKRAEDALGISREALAHATRVTSMGELIASIAHEVNQPLAAIVTNGYASLRWLQAEPRNLADADAAVTRVIADASRASEVISAIRAFLSRGDSQPTQFQVQEIIGDVMVLLRDQALRCGVSLRDNSAIDVPAVIANRVQIKQVILNLAMNAIEAMCAISGRARDLAVGVQRQSPYAILVSVRDSGNWLDPQHRERIFEAFFTTKPEGIGMGLAISRSIVDAHGGRLWSTPNNGFGETFQFTLPVADAGRA